VSKRKPVLTMEGADIKVVPNPCHPTSFVASLIRVPFDVEGEGKTEKDAAADLARLKFGNIARVRKIGCILDCASFQVHFNQEDTE